MELRGVTERVAALEASFEHVVNALGRIERKLDEHIAQHRNLNNNSSLVLILPRGKALTVGALVAGVIIGLIIGVAQAARLLGWL